MKILITYICMALLALTLAMCSAGSALAQEVEDEAPTVEQPEPSDSVVASDIVASYKAGKYLVALGLVLMIAVRLFRRGVWFIPALGEKLLRTSWFKTRAGGYALVAGLAVLEFAALKLSSDVPFSWEMLMGIATAAWVAISQHETIKDATA